MVQLAGEDNVGLILGAGKNGYLSLLCVGWRISNATFSLQLLW
jgi:hypothetical protein